MTSMAIATLYVGLFGLLMLALKFRVGQKRTQEKVGFGDGGNEAMQRAIRVQGNAVEDVPLVVLGLVVLGAMAAPGWLIHVLGATFFVGRVLHAVGLGGSSGGSFGRAAGTLLTALMQLATAGACIWFAVAQLL